MKLFRTCISHHENDVKSIFVWNCEIVGLDSKY